MSEDFPEGAHDAWLAGYTQDWVECWCSNPECVNHTSSIDVKVASEYGVSWSEPEDCPECHGDLVYSKPEEEEEDDGTDDQRGECGERASQSPAGGH